MAEKNKPIFKVRSGAIDCAVFKNVYEKDKKKFEVLTCSLNRSYTKDDGKTWEHETINLRKNNLINMIVVLQAIQNELFLNKSEKETIEE